MAEFYSAGDIPIREGPDIAMYQVFLLDE